MKTVPFRRYCIFLLGVFLLFSNQIQAKKYLTAEISWTVISKDTILVKFVLVSDCKAAKPDAPFLNVNCALTSEWICGFNMSLPEAVDITNACPLMGGSRCSNPNSVFPFGFAQYTCYHLLVLPDTLDCCKLKISFSKCCRTADIKTTSINQPLYTETILNRCLLEGLSAGFESTSAFIYITGLELVYKQAFKMSDLNKTVDSVKCYLESPVSASNSPFVYDTPYTYLLPLKFKGFPDSSLDFPSGFHLNSANGDLSFTGIIPQTTVLCIVYRFFKDGQTVAFLRREMYIAIMNYPVNTLPELIFDTNYKEVYAEGTLQFDFKTFDADTTNSVTVNYNSALPGAIWTNNNGQVKHPQATLKWVPSKSMISTIPYSFRITVSDNHCPSHGHVNYDFNVLVKDQSGVKNSISNKKFKLNYSSEAIIINIENELLQSKPVIELYDMQGRLIFSEKCKQDKISIQQLKNGLYLLYIKTSESVMIEKIQISY